MSVSPLLAALLSALLVAAPLACGVGLPDSLPVGNPEGVRTNWMILDTRALFFNFYL